MEEWGHSRVGDVNARRGVVQAVEIGIRQRFEEHSVEEAENGGIGSDAEREGDHRDGCKQGRLPQTAKDVPGAHGYNATAGAIKLGIYFGL